MTFASVSAWTMMEVLPEWLEESSNLIGAFVSCRLHRLHSWTLFLLQAQATKSPEGSWWVETLPVTLRPRWLSEHPGRARVETCPKARAVEGGGDQDQEAADSWQWHLKTLACTAGSSPSGLPAPSYPSPSSSRRSPALPPATTTRMKQQCHVTIFKQGILSFETFLVKLSFEKSLQSRTFLISIRFEMRHIPAKTTPQIFYTFIHCILPPK